jgi:TPR repeat protein
MRAKWIKDEETYNQLPARAWPKVQPNADAVPGLREVIESQCSKITTTNSTDECDTARFQLATALIFNNVDQVEGMKLYETLASEGHHDGTVGAGIVHCEGLAEVPPCPSLSSSPSPASSSVSCDPEKGLKYLQLAAAEKMNHPQAHFELGVLHYTGTGALPEDEQLALQYFTTSAIEGKLSYAEFMAADVMMERVFRGDGEDSAPPFWDAGFHEELLAEAVVLLHRAAESGHRMARCELLKMLEGKHQINVERK